MASFTNLITRPTKFTSPSQPLTLPLLLLYAAAGGFFSANLFYTHPILDLLTTSFNASQSTIANIPTLSSAGDVTGLLLIMPLADFFPRRRFALVLMTITVLLWLALCLSTNLTAFMVLTYLSSVTTGIPQIMLPLVSEFSPADKRAFNISIVATGPTLAILLARILSGIVANFTYWRNIYWLALGLQISMLILIWLFMPDYPATNPTPVKQILKQYPKIILGILKLYFDHPVLIQCSLLALLTFFTVASYWTTLTFLLSGSPYHYDTLAIGLFGLVGAATLFLGPLYARYIIKPLGVPLLSVAVGTTVSLTGIILGTFVGRFNVAGPVLQALLLDAGLMIEQIANRLSLHDISGGKGNRVNTAFVGMLYVGQLAGAKASNTVYERYGGWLASGGLNIGIMALCYVVVAYRGPNVDAKRWAGWQGGWRAKQSTKDEETGPNEKTVDRNSDEEPTVAEEFNAAQVVPPESREKSDTVVDIKPPKSG